MEGDSLTCRGALSLRDREQEGVLVFLTGEDVNTWPHLVKDTSQWHEPLPSGDTSSWPLISGLREEGSVRWKFISLLGNSHKFI